MFFKRFFSVRGVLRHGQNEPGRKSLAADFELLNVFRYGTQPRRDFWIKVLRMERYSRIE